MTPEGGGFFAAQDADSGGHEGTFYVWNPESVRDAVGADSAPLVCARFGVTLGGNFEGGETVLSVVRSSADLAAEFGESAARVEEILRDARVKMYAARARRVAPGTDDKLLTDWTALAISAFALGARRLGEPRYERAAREAADRILGRCRRDGQLLHRERAGNAAIPAFSADYAFFAEALLDLYEAAFDPRDFRQALAFQEELDGRFADPRGGYALSSDAHDGLILRPRELYERSDAVGQLRRRVELAPPRRVHGRRAPSPARRGDPRGQLGLPAPRSARAAPDALRARFRDVGAVRDRALRRARPRGLRETARRGLR